MVLIVRLQISKAHGLDVRQVIQAGVLLVNALKVLIIALTTLLATCVKDSSSLNQIKRTVVRERTL
jgi:hypothetical protein